MRRRKETSLNIRINFDLRRKLAFLAETQNRGLSDFARGALEKATAAAFHQIAAESEATTSISQSDPPAAA